MTIPLRAVADRVPLPREAWYIAAASSRLADVPLAVTIHALPIVLFRDEAGHPRALHDRCPHRGVALSLGSVTEGRIACAYHGWRFDGSGRCRHIPSLREEQALKDAPVRAYPAIEQDGYIWLWAGELEPQGRPAPIDGLDRYHWLQGSIDLACEAILPIENNLDICHAAFTHPNLHPQWFRVQAVGFTPNSYDIQTTVKSLVVSGSGTMLRFDLPNRVTVGGGDGFRLVLHHVPTVPGRCIQHWLLQREAVERAVPPAWSDIEPEILTQDRRVIESAQLAYEAEGDGFERSVEADAPTLAARRLLMLPTAKPPISVQETCKQVAVLN